MNRVTITLNIDLPDGVVPDVGYTTEPANAPLPAWPEEQRVYDRDERVAPPVPKADPICDHGPRYFKEGTNKNGKPYKGWFCKDDVCKPVWT